MSGKGRGRGRGKVVQKNDAPTQQSKKIKHGHPPQPNGHQLPNGQGSNGFPPLNGQGSNGFPPLNGQGPNGYPPLNGQGANGFPPLNGQGDNGYPSLNGQGANGNQSQHGQRSNGYPPVNGQGPNGYPPINGQGDNGYPPVNGQGPNGIQSQNGQPHNRGPPGFPALKELRENLPQPKQQQNVTNQVSNAVVPVKPKAQATPTPTSPQTLALAKMSPSDIQINGNRAKRPGYGTLGYKKIEVLTNYFKLNLPHGFVHQYDVDIERIEVDAKFKPPNRFLVKKTRKIFEKIMKDYKIFKSHLPVYDGNKIVITRRSLGINKPQEFRVTIEDEEQEEVYLVTIKPSIMRNGGKDGEIDLDAFHRYVDKKEGELPKEAIKAIDLVFKYGPSLVYTPVGKSFFRKPHVDDVPPSCEGREIWFGYCQSVRPCEWSPIINIDLTATTFYEAGPALEFLKKVTGIRSFEQSLRDFDLKKFNDEIKGLKVKVTHNDAYQRKFRVVGATRKDANQMTFPYSQPGKKDIEVSIKTYFKQRYRIDLRYPNLPLLQMQPKEKNIFIPIECCQILPDQHCRKKLSETMTAKMIRETLRTPKQRFKEIKQNVEDSKRRSQPYLQEFGIEMSTNPMVAEARVLNPPQIVYNPQDTFMPSQGQWTMQNHQFFQGAVIEAFAIINFGFCPKPARLKFQDMLINIGRECGMKFGECKYNEDLTETRMDILQILKRMKDKFPDIKLVVIILNSDKKQRTPATYEEVKQACDTQLGIVTQCVKDVNIKRCSPQLIGNICQKINAKMGGINNTITGPRGALNEKPKLMDSPVIIMGADVTHPAPDKDDPSIAAVVGSMDRHLTRYAARIKVQKNLAGYQARVEIILELKDMVKSLLMCFYKRINKKPGRIIFYRDGVSEGQFSDVCSYEINQIKHACQELEADYKPSITFIVVQKRHSTRFCPKNDRDGMGKAGNVPPGTTVDRGITSPLDFDFYLCSHYGLQGTSKPTHYTTLWDESNLSADEIQVLSYYLCHTYSRCTRSISLPAPVQYAHLAAFRARAHIKKVLDSSSASSANGRQKYGTMVAVDNIADAVTIEEKLADSMYYI